MPDEEVVDTTVMPALHPDLELSEFDDELVVFDPRVNQMHLVEGLSAVLLSSCDGATLRSTVRHDLVEVLDLDPTDADGRIDEALRLFAELGLLDGSEPPSPEPPCIGCAEQAPTRRSWRRGRR